MLFDYYRRNRDVKMAKVYIETYGCTLNQADSDIIKGILRNIGHELVENENEADVIVFNTCTVKGPTENKIFERMKRTTKPFVIAGCIYVNKKRILREIKNPVVISPGALGRIGKAVEAAIRRREMWITEDVGKTGRVREITAPILRVPIQEGCTGSCFFCQTKLARPLLKSYQPKTIRMWIEEGLKKGAKEMQITGMDSGAYGIDIGTDLPTLLESLTDIDGNFKIRLGMINPQHLNRFGDRLIGIMKSDKFYKFIHIPVQTGSERICRRMNRPHTVKDFIKWVKKFRAAIPNITIATDIIVGYPGETTADFKSTIALLQRVKPDVVNISKYTVRSGTKAALMKQLPTEIIKERSKEASEVVHRICAENNSKYIGKIVDVLVLEQNGRKGRTENYKQVVLDKKAKLGTWIKTKIERVNHSSLFGQNPGSPRMYALIR